MKTNVIVLATKDGNNIVAKALSNYVVEDENYWEHCLMYFQAIDGTTWVSADNKPVEKCHPDLIVEAERETRHGGQHYRKMNRLHRISLMTEYLWAPDDMFGKNRRLRRRMWPSPENIREAEEYLPF